MNLAYSEGLFFPPELLKETIRCLWFNNELETIVKLKRVSTAFRDVVCQFLNSAELRTQAIHRGANSVCRSREQAVRMRSLYAFDRLLGSLKMYMQPNFFLASPVPMPWIRELTLGKKQRVLFFPSPHGLPQVVTQTRAPSQLELQTQIRMFLSKEWREAFTNAISWLGFLEYWRKQISTYRLSELTTCSSHYDVVQSYLIEASYEMHDTVVTSSNEASGSLKVKPWANLRFCDNAFAAERTVDLTNEQPDVSALALLGEPTHYKSEGDAEPLLLRQPQYEKALELQGVKKGDESALGAILPCFKLYPGRLSVLFAVMPSSKLGRDDEVLVDGGSIQSWVMGKSTIPMLSGIDAMFYVIGPDATSCSHFASWDGASSDAANGSQVSRTIKLLCSIVHHSRLRSKSKPLYIVLTSKGEGLKSVFEDILLGVGIYAPISPRARHYGLYALNGKSTGENLLSLDICNENVLVGLGDLDGFDGNFSVPTSNGVPASC